MTLTLQLVLVEVAQQQVGLAVGERSNLAGERTLVLGDRVLQREQHVETLVARHVAHVDAFVQLLQLLRAQCERRLHLIRPAVAAHPFLRRRRLNAHRSNS